MYRISKLVIANSATTSELAAKEPAIFTGSEFRNIGDDVPLAQFAVAFDGASWTDPDSTTLMVMQAMLGAYTKGSSGGKHMGLLSEEIIAFAFTSTVKAKRLQSRATEKEQRRLHLPVVNRNIGEEPPFVVVVQGPPQVGKSLVIKSLVKHYTKHKLPEVRGPITIVTGKQRRVQFVECPNDINGMIDAAKFADLALLLIDGSYGFEMETFEFLNIMQNHGFPKVMGVLTHLDKFKDVKKLRKTKQRLKHRFWTEIYDGAKLFYLSRLIHGKYAKREVHNLARFISVMKFHPLSWRKDHPYVLVDRFEDVTPPEKVEQNNKCDRNVTLYGYLRGCNLKKDTKVTWPYTYTRPGYSGKRHQSVPKDWWTEDISEVDIDLS
ncbi:Ribosome biogenesis BMS1 [Heracleum sosnowskyi]|uniref:Ribosome biogenesis BMS1 n=1 Tax=Heracleum sosnowskyi TaxID=360622 RepID=A0AAD8IX28_9APIA|nr:Ribosome biogenesis BMS1 [Heracleum sosnowskyi]